jgi:hypothetical protein
MAKQTFTAGQVLTAAQVTALQTNIPGQDYNAKTSNYTLVLGDAGRTVTMNNTSLTLTVPPASSVAFATGDTIKVINLHSTALTIAGGSGVTVNAAAGLTLSQYQSAEIILTATSNSWVLAESAVTATASGGLEPASPLLLMGG